ncbi:MAG TPA: tetratricopeptide repeat protein [Burkholderiales bacterium]|nr:tetratricopeptide repeat protein [Burkholderiales bacterium]
MSRPVAGAGMRHQVARFLERAQAQFQAAAYREAGDIAQRVLALDANNAEAYHLLGAIAHREERFAEAEALLDKAISLNRRSPYFRHSLGNVYRAQGKFEAAEAAYRQALKLDPGLSAAYLGLATALRTLGRSRDAVVYLERYLQREPNDAEAYNELGLNYLELGRLDLAVEQLRAALRLNPAHKAARDNIALVLLLAENFREGWPAWLRSLTELPFPHPSTATAPFEGRRVLIHGSMGVGDEIMYASCLPALTPHAEEVTLHCDRRLAPLFERSFPSVRTVGVDRQGHTQHVIGILAPDEIHIAGSFLPAYFPPNIERFARRRSFLVADPAQVAEWRKRFDGLGTGLRIGLSWRGGADPVNRRQRSIPLAAWGSILAVRGVHFVNLQYGDVDGEIEEARLAVPINRWRDANPLADLDFFAAQIAALDLVISVDNTTVHMAGALGIATWALLPKVPDWRWTMAGTTTHWYPSVRLLRQQEAGRWEGVMQEVATRLESCVAAGLVDT